MDTTDQAPIPTCPYCGEQGNPGATVCRACGRQYEKPQRTTQIYIAIALIVVLLLVGVRYVEQRRADERQRHNVCSLVYDC